MLYSELPDVEKAIVAKKCVEIAGKTIERVMQSNNVSLSELQGFFLDPEAEWNSTKPDSLEAFLGEMTDEEWIFFAAEMCIKEFLPAENILSSLVDPDPKPSLVFGHVNGPDGNAIEILQSCIEAAEEGGWSRKEIDDFTKDATTGAYSHLMETVNKHFRVVEEGEEEEEEEEEDGGRIY